MISICCYALTGHGSDFDWLLEISSFILRFFYILNRICTEVACLSEAFVVMIPEDEDLKKDILFILMVFDFSLPIFLEYSQLRIV